MSPAAVRVRVATNDFYLLPREDSLDAARDLATRLLALRELPDASLSLQPRLAPDDAAPDVPTADGRPYEPSDEDTSLADPDEPGREWHFIEGPAIQETEALTVTEPTAFWHWRIREAASPGSVTETE